MAFKVLKRTDNQFARYSTAKLPECNFKPKKYTGPSIARIEHIKSTNIPPAIFDVYQKPLIIHQGHKQWLYDHEGRRYLDLFGGIATISVGHSHPKIAAALQEQIGTLWHTTNIYRHPKIYEYAEKLITKFPKPLEVVYFANSGTEANDLAVVLSRLYTGNQDIVSLQGSYHGCSSGLMSLTSTQAFRQPNMTAAGYYHAMVPNPYRGIWGGCRDSLSQVPGACCCPGDCLTSDKYVHELSELLNNSVPSGRLASMFAEPIQGVNGIVQYPKGYLRKARDIVKKNGGLFVADEVQTGFGRTGNTFWCFESEGIIPDIVTMAKGIGNGFPLAAVVTTKEIADAHTRAMYFNTFGGNALACTVGKAVLDVIEEENIQENSKTVGKYFIEQLMQLQKQYPIIGDVRGKGLMIGLDLVKPGTKEPADNGADIYETIRDLGVLIGSGGRWTHNLKITPPMCINKDDFTSKVLKCDETKESIVDYGKIIKFEGYQIVLENTILFPAGGGQPHDIGWLDNIEVLQVLRKGDEALHFTKEPLAIGTTVTQKIQWERRFDHMQQHSGQHLLSAILEKEYALPTTSWWLGADESYVELDATSVTEDVIKNVETRCNELIRDAVPVNVKFCKANDPDLNEAHTRGLPKDCMDTIRIICIGDIDENMCCGTHVTNLSQLQVIKLVGTEPGKKGKTNLKFQVGNRVRKTFQQMLDRERALTALLKNEPNKHEELVSKLQKNFKITNKSLQNVLSELAQFEVDRIKNVQPKPKYIFMCKKEATPDFNRAICKALEGDSMFLFLASSEPDKPKEGQIIIQGPEEHCNELGQQITELLKAKGAFKHGKFQGKAGDLSGLNKCKKIIDEYFANVS
ncbi:PREDICTED: alanine--glyoxylate aminotransferase 2, mitochondrial-like [Papilio polytes]|uniref:alanine--glyoxylate aminotransferase 2, mitochondrial-like n=1 Tax=Papilio polytes TaxID=76194 RepID=UPI000676A8F7|nr:PREDICTED: alanine--glyoxylate aminotransferase 2, mitochondrial-like [Papilio polytes]